MVCIHAGDATRGRQRTGMVLSCCRRHERMRLKKEAAIIWEKIRGNDGRPQDLSQKRMLKTELEDGWRAFAARKDGLKMFHGLQQRIDVRAGGW